MPSAMSTGTFPRFALPSATSGPSEQGRGFLATARSLWYVNGGWTRSDFDVTEPGFTSVSKSLNGFFVGGGVEQSLSRNASLKLEYRFSDYEDFNFGGTTFDNTVHSVRLGVSWKFH
jgi:outer membrane immunogenic protein